MVELKYYTYGQYVKKIKVSDKAFTVMLLNKSLEFSHQNKEGKWYRDDGCGVYLMMEEG